MSANEKKDVLKDCPYCKAELVSWQPPEGSNWTEGVYHVCFNDSCPYFVRGWKWMFSHYQQNVSYRFKYNHETGETGPLPVWSKTALREQILTNE